MSEWNLFVNKQKFETLCSDQCAVVVQNEFDVATNIKLGAVWNACMDNTLSCVPHTQAVQSVLQVCSKLRSHASCTQMQLCVHVQSRSLWLIASVMHLPCVLYTTPSFANVMMGSRTSEPTGRITLIGIACGTAAHISISIYCYLTSLWPCVQIQNNMCINLFLCMQEDTETCMSMRKPKVH